MPLTRNQYVRRYAAKLRANPDRYRKACEKRNAYYSEYQGRRIQELRTEILLLLGNKCALCDYSDKRAIDIDHINGGGTKHRRSRGPLKFLNEVKANPAGYRLLCRNCNWITWRERSGYREVGY